MQQPRLKPLILQGIIVAALATSAPALAVSQEAILERLMALEENQQKLQMQLAERDARIAELEQRLGVGSTQGDLTTLAVAPQNTASDPSPSDPIAVDVPRESSGKFNGGGRGYQLADTPYGSLNFSGWTYVRYLNQQGLDDSYTDSFGRDFDIDDLFARGYKAVFLGLGCQEGTRLADEQGNKVAIVEIQAFQFRPEYADHTHQPHHTAGGYG